MIAVKAANRPTVAAPPAAQGPAVAQEPGTPNPEPSFGLWRSARLTDTSRPLNRYWRVGQKVYYRDGDMLAGAGGIPTLHLFNGGARLWIVELQLDGSTAEHAADVDDRAQARLSAAWQALEPKHAGYHPGTQIPVRYWGRDVLIPPDNRNPELGAMDGKPAQGWQGDSTHIKGSPPDMAYILEGRVLVDPPDNPGQERLAEIALDWLGHERVELDRKMELVNRKWPYISEADWYRCMDEMEGIAHAITVAEWDGYHGEDGPKRYLIEKDYRQMRELGFGKLVDQWEKTDL